MVDKAGTGKTDSGSTEAEPAVTDQASSDTNQRCGIFYRLQRYAHRHFPSLIKDPVYQEILRTSRIHDEEDNAKTEPPDDELIDLRCIWAVEFYTPSHVDQLLKGFDELGWDKEDPALKDYSPARWIQQIRETPHGGGWLNLGPIHRTGDRRFFSVGHAAPLPPQVDYALAAMHSITSSITCIVIGFVVNEDNAQQFGETLRRKRQTVLEPRTGGRYRLPGPSSQKAHDIQIIRGEIKLEEVIQEAQMIRDLAELSLVF